MMWTCGQTSTGLLFSLLFIIVVMIIFTASSDCATAAIIGDGGDIKDTYYSSITYIVCTRLKVLNDY